MMTERVAFHEEIDSDTSVTMKVKGVIDDRVWNALADFVAHQRVRLSQTVSDGLEPLGRNP